MLHIHLRLVGLNIYFYIFFFTIKRVQKRGTWKGEDFFAMRFYEGAPGRSIMYYLQALGKTPREIDRFQRAETGFARMSGPSSQNLPESLSIPAAL